MLLEKDFVMQGGVRNYLGKTEEVKAPKYWKSSQNSPSTELVYITEAEKGLLADANLHGSMINGQPNVGASGLLSFDGFGSRDPGQNRAGGDVSGAMDRGQDDSGQQSSGGGSTSAFQGNQSTQYNTAMSEDKEQRVEAKNVVDLVNAGVNINDALTGKTSLERVLGTTPISLGVLNEIISPFANAANKKRRTSWLEGTDKFDMPRSRDFYIQYKRPFDPNATLVKGTPEYEFLEDSGYFAQFDNNDNNQGGGGDNNTVTLFDNPDDVETIETNEISMVNDYFNNLGSSTTSPLSPKLESDYNLAKNKINNLLSISPVSQQFGYSNDPYGGLLASNLQTNPFNIQYLQTRGLI